MVKTAKSLIYNGLLMRNMRLSNDLSLRQMAISLGISKSYYCYLEAKPFEATPEWLDDRLDRLAPPEDHGWNEVQRAAQRRANYMHRYGKLEGRRRAAKEEALLRRRGRLKNVPLLAD